jgi:hypothetical protein
MITERLVRMETKIDFLSERLAHNEGRLSNLERFVATPNVDHEARIRKLEKIVWVAMGFAAAGGGLIGGFVSSWLGV